MKRRGNPKSSQFRAKIGLVATLTFLAALPTCAAAEEVRQPWTIIFPMIENDSFFGISDRHYTNGLYASATSGKQPDCNWCRSLADTLMLRSGVDGPDFHYGFFAGQSMFTPEDLSLFQPDSRDRPYGGWLYIGARLYRETDDVLDRAQVTIGVVGPGSGADAVQRWWHALHWFGGVPPQGWHAQIKDEPGLVLTEQRIWRVSLTRGSIDTELLPEATASLGNVFTYAGAGATLRVGQSLLADWGPARIEPSLDGSDFANFDQLNPLAWSLFAGFEVRAVARNIFLDGNSFQHSANVTKVPLVADFDAGAAILWKWIRFQATYTVRTHEFETQNGNDRFFSFTLSFAH